jgi:hypothetical protein
MPPPHQLTAHLIFARDGTPAEFIAQKTAACLTSVSASSLLRNRSGEYQTVRIASRTTGKSTTCPKRARSPVFAASFRLLNAKSGDRA